MVGPKEGSAFFYMLKKYRDDRTGLIKEFKEAIETQSSE